MKCLSIALALTLAACRSVGATHTLVCEQPSGLQSYPARVLASQVSGEIIPLTLVDLAPGIAYHGMSGAPMYDQFGALAGGFVRGFYQIGEDPIGVLPTKEIEYGMKLGQEYGTRLTGAGTVQCPTLTPGMCVGAFYIWGDSAIGSTGAITKIDGDKLLAFAHAAADTRLGPRVFALARTPVLVLVKEAGEQKAICSRTAPIGTVTYNGRRGIYAVTGVEPPHIALSLSAYRKSTQESHLRRLNIAKDPYLLQTGVGQAMKLALDGFGDLDERGTVVGVEVRCGKGAPSSWEWEMPDEFSAEAIAQSVLEKLPPDLATVDSVDVSLAVP